MEDRPNRTRPAPVRGNRFAERIETLATKIGDLDSADGWPLTWPCPRCGQTVGLDRDTAGRVGRARRLVCASVADHK